MFAFNYLRSVFDADEPAVCLLRLKPNVEAVTPPRDGGEQRRHEGKVIIPYYGRKASEKTRVGIVRGREGCYNLLGGREATSEENEWCSAITAFYITETNGKVRFAVALQTGAERGGERCPRRTAPRRQEDKA